MAERISLGADVDICEEGERLHAAILGMGVVGHVGIALTNRLTFDTTEMDGLLLRVMLHDINDRKPVHGEQMFIRSIPNGASSRGRVVKVHAMPGS